MSYKFYHQPNQDSGSSENKERPRQMGLFGQRIEELREEIKKEEIREERPNYRNQMYLFD